MIMIRRAEPSSDNHYYYLTVTKTITIALLFKNKLN